MGALQASGATSNWRSDDCTRDPTSPLPGNASSGPYIGGLSRKALDVAPHADADWSVFFHGVDSKARQISKFNVGAASPAVNVAGTSYPTTSFHGAAGSREQGVAGHSGFGCACAVPMPVQSVSRESTI